MQKVIRVDKKVIVLFEDGSYCEKDNVSDDLFRKILESTSEEETFLLMNPAHTVRVKEYNEAVDLMDSVDQSSLLTLKGESIYWEEVSQLSLPVSFAKAVLDAEFNNDVLKLETYKNFWTLMSLNPDEECRKNLFWFLDKWGLKIAKCGFFVAYRNAVPHSVDKEGREVFTDAHSGTTRIKIGEMVTMPREKCDRDSSHSCSRGLVCSPVY